MKKMKPPSTKNEITGPKSTILYVEDESDNWEVTQLRLGQKYQLHLAENDQQACAFVRERAHEHFTILMDIQLKGSILNGIQLTKLFRGLPADVELPDYARDLPPIDHVPIFFVTAYSAAYSEHALMKAGAAGVITKPVDFVKLMRALTGLHLRRVE